MAKKKSGGPSVGLIITLVFFILATFIAGTVAYFGYAEQDKFTKEAEAAKKDKATSESQMRDQRVRTLVHRIAIGVDEPGDRTLLVAELDALRPQIKEEYDRILRGLDGKVPDVQVPDPADPTKRRMIKIPASTWRLLGATKIDDPNTDPDVAPVKTLPAMIEIYKADADKARADKKLSDDARVQAEKARNESNVDKQKNDDTFKEALKKIDEQKTSALAKLDTDFKALKDKHAKDHDTPTKRAAELGAADVQKADEIAKLSDKIKDLTEKLAKYEGQSAGSRLNAGTVDFVNMEERKGTIVRKDDNGIVTISIGRARKIKPQITFLVVSADVSWLALLEKEESLKKNSGRLDRQPFEENPYVKAGIEVVEVIDNESSRAKVMFENEPIRNPIQPRDQIFNLAWEPDEEIRVAFAGIIDLDGDGLDNNEDFLRLLERQGVIVDEYLKMKPLDFVKRDNKGMTLRTKYLVIAPDPRLDALPAGKDTPQTLQIQATIEKMSDIKARARELGIQMIEARKFLAMIGYKLPKNPVQPAYGAGTYLDPNVVPDPKKGGN